MKDAPLAMNNLAGLYESTGRYAEAETHYWRGIHLYAVSVQTGIIGLNESQFVTSKGVNGGHY